MTWWDRLRGALRSNEELTDADRRSKVEAAGAAEISTCADRRLVTVRGVIETLTVQPRQNTAWLEAEMSDGTGRVTLIWMGRHVIPGIEAGRELLASGRISVADGQRRLFNPRYELL